MPRTDHLWLLIVLAGFSFYVSLIPLPPNDFWWHLKIGEIIGTMGQIPQTNIFAWTLPPDHPFMYGAWLGELLFYVIYTWGGLALLTATRTFLALVTFGLVSYEARRRSNSWRIAALAVAFACLVSLNNLPVRTQMWSWLPFILYLILLSAYAEGGLQGTWLLVCPVLMVFWVNAHGAFVLGIVLLSIFTVGEAFRTLIRQEKALPWRSVGWLAGVTALTAVATLASPHFIGIVDYVLGLMTDRPSQSLVVEWQSPTPVGIANVTFYVSILALLPAFAYSRYRPTPTETLLLLGFLWLAWSGQRYVIWFGMVAMPLFARALHEIPVPWATPASQRSLLNLVLTVVLYVPVLLVQPWFVERLPLPDTYWAQVWRDRDEGPLMSVETPVAAVEYLAAHPGGQLFNEMGYGSYLIWALPEQKVFIDPRVELYPYDQWLDYIRIGRGIRYNELLEAYGANRILLSRALQEELAEQLASDSLWLREYEDSYAQIWRRKN